MRKHLKRVKRIRLKKDPFFKTIGSFETKEGNWSERKDWR